MANILGSGTFGQVVRREIDGQHVAVKMFHAATRDNALQEVAASAAMGAHPCVIQLLDALVVGNQVHLVYPLWDQTLSQLLVQRKACPPPRLEVRRRRALTYSPACWPASCTCTLTA